MLKIVKSCYGWEPLAEKPGLLCSICGNYILSVGFSAITQQEFYIFLSVSKKW